MRDRTGSPDDQPRSGDKDEWRRWARSHLDASAIDHDGTRRALARFLADDRRAPGWVVAFLGMSDEVDLRPLLTDVRCGPFALVRTVDGSDDLTVHRADGPRERHRYGFEQPAAAGTVDDAEIAVVLVPGLLFARDGGRLGRGRGYYDRFLARLGDGVARIGITGAAIVDRVPTEPHDRTMTHLAHRSGVDPVPLSSR